MRFQLPCEIERARPHKAVPLSGLTPNPYLLTPAFYKL